MSTGKKWVIFLLSFVSFIFIFLLSIPFLIDLNKYKPQIQSVLSSKINAQIDFASAQLTIFSGLGLNLKDVTLVSTDKVFTGNQFLHIKNLTFKINLVYLLKRQIVGTIDIRDSQINFFKKGLENNFKNLIKSKENKNLDSSLISKEFSNKTDENVDSNSFLKDLIFKNKMILKNINIRNTTLNFIQIQKNTLHEVQVLKNIDISIHDLGINKDTKVKLFFEINKETAKMSLKGPVVLNINSYHSLEKNVWKKSHFEGSLNLNDLEINIKDSFFKKKNTPLLLTFNGSFSEKDFIVEDIKSQFKSLESKFYFEINDFKKLSSKIKISLAAENFSDLSNFFPQYKEELSHGSLNIQAHMEGNLDQSSPLKSDINLNLKLLHSDALISFHSQSLFPMEGFLKIESKNLDFKEIEGLLRNKDTKQEIAQKKDITEKNEKEYISFYKKRKVFLENSHFDFNIKVKKIFDQEFSLENIDIQGNLFNENLVFNSIKMNAFFGNVLSKLNINLNNSPIKSYGSMVLNKIRFENVLEFLKPELGVPPLEGLADIKMDFDVKGLTKKEILNTLHARGSYFFTEGVLNTHSLIRLAGEEFQKFIKNSSLGMIKKDPSSFFMKNTKNEKFLLNRKGIFEIQNGKILFKKNFITENGLLKLNANIGLDASLNGAALYIANKKLEQKLLSEFKHIHYLLNEKGDLELNLTLGGTLTSPEVMINKKLLQEKILKKAKKDFSRKIKEKAQKIFNF